MNITSIEELQTLVDNGFRVLFLKDEDKEGEQFNEPGPYRIIVFKFPRLKDQADEVRASGATMELAAKDINDNLKDVDDLREFIGLANSMDASVIIGDPSEAVN